MTKLDELLRTFYYYDPDELGEDAFKPLSDDEIGEVKQAIKQYISEVIDEIIGRDEEFDGNIDNYKIYPEPVGNNTLRAKQRANKERLLK